MNKKLAKPLRALYGPFAFHMLWIVPFALMIWGTFAYTSHQYREAYHRQIQGSLERIVRFLRDQTQRLDQQATLLSRDNAVQTTLALDLRPQLSRYLKKNLHFLNLYHAEAPFQLYLQGTDHRPILALSSSGSSPPSPACAEAIVASSEHIWLSARAPVFYEGRRVGELCLLQDLIKPLKNLFAQTPEQSIVHGIRLQYAGEPEQNAPYLPIDTRKPSQNAQETYASRQIFHLNRQTLTLTLYASTFRQFFLSRLQRHHSFWLLTGVMLGTFLLYLTLQLWLTHRLKQEKAQHQAIVSSLDEGVLIVDEAGHVSHNNPAARNLLPGNPAQPLWQALRLYDADTDKPIVLSSLIRNVLSTGRPWHASHFVKLISPDHTVHFVSLTVRPLPTTAHAALMVVDFEDQTWQLLEEIRWQASHHPLTELINYRALKEKTHAWLPAAQNRTDDAARPEGYFLLINYDHFKAANDTLGHTLGDAIIRRMADRLETLCVETLPSAYYLAHLEGAEFAVVYRAESENEAERLMHALHQGSPFTFAYEQHVYRFTASFGLTPLTPYDQDLDSVLNRASMAVRFVKKQGGNNAVSSTALQDYTAYQQQTLNLIPTLQKALQTDAFELVGQRILDMNRPDALPRFEVLLRLKDDKGQYISPALFIPAAEQFGLVREIDRWVIRETIRQIAELYHYEMDERLHSYRFSINLSSISLSDETLYDEIVRQCRQHGVPLHALGFEVTETAVISQWDSAHKLLRQLREAGATLLLDDFGTGMSSLGYLKRFPLDIIKIDGSFVRDMLENATDRAIVNAISTLASQLDCQTVAEFVENEALIAALREMGIAYGQGYGIEPPKPLAQCIRDISRRALDTRLHDVA